MSCSNWPNFAPSRDKTRDRKLPPFSPEQKQMFQRQRRHRSWHNLRHVDSAKLRSSGTCFGKLCKKDSEPGLVSLFFAHTIEWTKLIDELLARKYVSQCFEWNSVASTRTRTQLLVHPEGSYFITTTRAHTHTHTQQYNGDDAPNFVTRRKCTNLPSFDLVMH